MAISKKSVVLLSGGLDSTTTLAVAKKQGYDVYALSFDYGQRHDVELESARRVAEFFEVSQHLIMKLDLRAVGGSALTSDLDVPKGRHPDEMAHGIPVTYVPARNLTFLSLATGWAEKIGRSDIFIGVNALDYSGYPDCRPEFIESFEKTAHLATKAGVEGTFRLKIHTPLIALTKEEIIRTGLELGVDYSLTSSCYDPSTEGEACGQCDSCLLRLKGFASQGVKDPIKYRAVASAVA